MTLQVIDHSHIATSFPTIQTDPLTILPTNKLEHLFFSVTAKMLIGYFEADPSRNDLDIGTALHTNQQYNRGIFARLWRNGQRLLFVTDPVQTGTTFQGSHKPYVAVSDAGYAAWAPDESQGGTLKIPGEALITQALGNTPIKFYRVNDFWPNDIHTGQVLGERSWLSTTMQGVLRPALSGAWLLTTYENFYGSGADTRPMVVRMPSGVVLWTGPATAPTSYYHARHLLYIDGQTAAITFMQGVGTADATRPALIRVFDTASTPWTLLWTDALPGSAHVAAWDAAHELLYCMGKWVSGDTMWTCRLRRAPVAPTPPTLVGASALRELTATTLSTLVKDGLGSVMSAGVLVRWVLSGSLSGGALVSNYSYTNDSGVATITYVGPRNPAPGLTETIEAAVSDLDY